MITANNEVMMMSKIRCDADVLARVLAAVKPAVGTRSAIQALSGVQVRVKRRGGAFLAATDMDVAVEKPLPHERVNDGPGFVALVSHALLAKTVKLFGTKPVTLEPIVTHDPGCTLQRDKRRGLRKYVGVTISNGKRTVTLPGLDPRDYPPLDFAGDELWLTAPGPALAAHTETATKFASRNETRPILTGVLVEHTNADGTRLVATDSYRLVVRHLADVSASREAQVNIPARLFDMTRKAMRAADTVQLGLGANRAVLHVGDERWLVRTIDGQYPNYRQLMPETFELEVAVPRATFLAGCKAAVALAEKNSPMRVAVNGDVRIQSRVPDGPELDEVLEGARVTNAFGQPKGDELLEFGFNPDFMLDIAKAVQGDTANLRLINPLRPGLVADGDTDFLIMPIRLNY